MYALKPMCIPPVNLTFTFQSTHLKQTEPSSVQDNVDMADVDALTGSQENPCLLLTQAQVKAQTLSLRMKVQKKCLYLKEVQQWLKSADMADAEGLTGSERNPCLRLTQAQASAQTQTLDLKIPHAMDQPIHACL